MQSSYPAHSIRQRSLPITHPSLLIIIVLLALSALSLHCQPTDAAITKGTLWSSSPFVFIGKFCFQHRSSGQLVGDIDAHLAIPIEHEEMKGTKIVYYDDQDESWPMVLANWDSWSCEQKVAAAKTALSYPHAWHRSDDGRSWMLSTHLPGIVQKLRPRTWFFVLARCNAQTTPATNGQEQEHENESQPFRGLHYLFHFTQRDVGSWSMEFGSNIMNINTMYLLAFIMFTLLLVWHFRGNYELSQRFFYLHPLLRLFFVVLLVDYVGLLALLVHYLSFTRDGVGIPALGLLGECCTIVSRACFMTLLLLLAQGWTVSKAEMDAPRLVRVTTAAYGLGALGLHLYRHFASDPRLSFPTHSIEVASTTLHSVWLLMSGMFICFCVRSYQREDVEQKRKMYAQIAIFTPWFIVPPLCSLLSFLVDPWARDHWITFLNLSATLVAYAMLAYLFVPHRAEEFLTTMHMGRRKYHADAHAHVQYERL